MSAAPPLAVSVVMSTYDQPEQVKQTIDNVLAQEGIELEFIIVDDGAEAAVRDVLAEYEGESRVVLLSQHNQGLTTALSVACQRVKNPYIARIDVGDLMVQGRLRQQAQLLENDASVGMVCSSVETVTEEGFYLYQQNYDQSKLTQGLTSLNVDEAKNPFHASVMFRTDTYREVGGYRTAFYFAQDSDLWSRMIEVSGLAVIDSVLTKGLISPNGISGQYTMEQGRLHELAVAARECRRSGNSEQPVLEAASKVRPTTQSQRRSSFDGLYYIAKCLLDSRSNHATAYFFRALVAKPWALKAWVYLIPSLLIFALPNRKSTNE